MKAYAPNGKPIIGTADSILATAHTDPEGWGRNTHGVLTFDYSDGSTIHWDTAEVETGENRLRYFYDADGNKWREDQVVLK